MIFTSRMEFVPSSGSYSEWSNSLTEFWTVGFCRISQVDLWPGELVKAEVELHDFLELTLETSGVYSGPWLLSLLLEVLCTVESIK